MHRRCIENKKIKKEKKHEKKDFINAFSSNDGT